MPHVVVKVVPRKSEEQKARLAESIAKDVIAIFGSSEAAVSVAIEEVEPDDWTEKVYKPDIHAKWDSVYKKPGYNPLEK
jgi:4-oxalocrotonate tautomerase